MRSTDWAGAARVVVRSCGLTADDLTALVSAWTAAGVQSVDLGKNPLGPEAAAALLRLLPCVYRHPYARPLVDAARVERKRRADSQT